MENPYKDYVFLHKEMITQDTPIPSLPEKPEALTDDQRDKKTNEFENELLKLEDKKKDKIRQLKDLNATLRSQQQPDDVKEASIRKRTLIDSKQSLLEEKRPLTHQLREIKVKLREFNDQKPDKYKKKERPPPRWGGAWLFD